jgi:uncharacterized protein (TIGR02118 family)
MTTLLALYGRDGDDDAWRAFEAGYRDEHLPLIGKLPGLRTIRVARVRRALTGGDGLALVARMAFADWDAAKAALSSPEMAAAGESLARLSGARLEHLLVVEEAADLIPEPFR